MTQKNSKGSESEGWESFAEEADGAPVSSAGESVGFLNVPHILAIERLGPQELRPSPVSSTPSSRIGSNLASSIWRARQHETTMFAF